MKNFASLILLLFCAACAAKGTTVVLLEDMPGKVGKVDVSTAKGAQLLDAKGKSTSVAEPGATPSVPRVMSDADIDKKFHTVLGAEPQPSKHYLLYFESGKTTLVAESVALLDVIAVEAKKSVLCDMAVIGHSDTKGTKEKNIALSLERANAVRDQLVQKGVSAECMAITSHGEGNLLVPTADEVDEPKNRRVEVVIR